jgi:DNA topoisomerase-1
VLGDVRAQVKKDLAKDGTKAQLCALAVSLIDQAYFRVGNEESDDNGVYGVTTLEARHVDVSASGRVDFEFVGKKRVEQHRVVVDKRIAKVLKRLLAKTAPDERVLRHEGSNIDAGDVNRYLEKFDVTAKQFRTFHATRLLREQLAEHRDVPKGEREAVVDAAFEQVAALLGHTPAVCRKSYVDPTVVESYLAGKS